MIAPEYVEEWKRLLSDACSRLGIDPNSLDTERVALLQDGCLKVWIDDGEATVASMTVPRDRWVCCEGFSPE